MATTEYNEVFEDAADSSTVRTIHRVRANSTIMHLNKIMGNFDSILSTSGGRLLTCDSVQQLPTVEKFVSDPDTSVRR
jgi:hypothetical protein